ncbi:SusE domain-containing protein [Geofilum rhodophaeum]|uniref:SusE domain-containing protein n=1 Tax=Geofilum rhodophaeum TaxID=1965019 RepID=UPI000B520CD2|nr:SusE domain-containing protein [Geofilum rhodophaeum]
MKANFLKYIALFGLVALLSSCEKDEDQIFMKENPVAPSIDVLPDLMLSRDQGNEILEFECSPVDAGFEASARYFLEVDASGNDFANPLVVYNGVQGEVISMTVSELNTILLRKFAADLVSDAEFRLRAVLVVDGGTGAPGTGSNTFQYISSVRPAGVFAYGLPRLDLLGSGVDQKVESALGDGVYKGFVKLSADHSFTLYNPDTETEYGLTAGALAADGAAITPGGDGYYYMVVDLNENSYSLDAYMIGLVGNATPNGWDAPDTKMDYDAQSGTWYITADLVDGEIKFRKNDGWAWNLGFGDDKDLGNLVQGGENIPVTAGNYTITLTIVNDATGSAVITQN